MAQQNNAVWLRVIMVVMVLFIFNTWTFIKHDEAFWISHYEFMGSLFFFVGALPFQSSFTVSFAVIKRLCFYVVLLDKTVLFACRTELCIPSCGNKGAVTNYTLLFF